MDGMETYRRAQDEYRRRSGKTDGASVAVCEELGQCMEFCRRRRRLLLNPALSGTFPQSARATARGACQLLDVMRGSSGIPNGYLERLASKSRRGRPVGGGGGEDFRRIARLSTRGMSPLGNFDGHLKTMYQLCA